MPSHITQVTVNGVIIHLTSDGTITGFTMEWGDLGGIIMKVTGQTIHIETIFVSVQLTQTFWELFPTYPYIPAEQKTFATLKGYPIPKTLVDTAYSHRNEHTRTVLTRKSLIYYYGELIRTVAKADTSTAKTIFLHRAREHLSNHRITQYD